MGKFNLDILKNYLKENENYSLLETGTFMGETIQKLLHNDFFKEYHSIEIDINRFNKCADIFRKYTNVHLYLGDSSTKIDEIILSNPDKRFICWLDAHHMGDSSKRGSIDCPLIRELDQLKQLTKNPVIFIDDMFYMLNRDDPRYERPKNPEHWPTYDELITKLNEINPEYEIITSLVKGKEDYLLAFPKELKK
jgi:hypothetical protein